MSITHSSHLTLADRVKKIGEQSIAKNKAKTDTIEVTESSSVKVKPVMRPTKHPQLDLFIADIFNISENIYNDMASLEFPLFSLKSSKEVRVYENKSIGFTLSITPSVTLGTPTIYDADVWIFAISKLIKAVNEGKPIDRTIRFTAYDFLISTNRDTSQKEYERLLTSLRRLHSTSITTTHEWSDIHKRPKFVPADTNTDQLIKGFHFIDDYKIYRNKHTKKLEAIEITLSNWLFRAIEKRAVLKMSNDYFRISSPLHRRIYEISRKHCGNQPEFKISLAVLREKTASTATHKKFKQMIKQLQNSDMPDYTFELDEYFDIVTIRPKTKGDDIQ